MPKVSQLSFTAGELAPAIQARADLAKYQVGTKLMRNVICHVHGGASNRPGTYFVDETKASAKKTRLLPFVYSATRSYALEFGDSTLRFVTFDDQGEHGLVYQDLVSAGVFKWTASAHGTDEYRLEIASGGSPGVMQVMSLYFENTLLTAGTAGSLAVGQWAWGDNDTLGYSTLYVRMPAGEAADPDAQVDGALWTNIELATPYGEDDLLDIQFTQSADVMFLVHPDYPPQKISRYGDYEWEIEPLDATGDGPYSSDHDPASAQPAAYTGSNVQVVFNEALFEAKHVGTPLRIGYANPLDASDIRWGYGIINSLSGAGPLHSVIYVNILEPLGYELIFNPEFEQGLLGWERSASGVSYSGVSAHFVQLTHGSGLLPAATLKQNLEVMIGEQLTLDIHISAMIGTLRVSVGKQATDPSDGSYGKDVVDYVSYTTTGTKTITFTSTAAKDIFILLTTDGSSTGQYVQISRINLKRTDKTTAEFRLAAFNAVDGYPRAVGIFEQRLCFAGTKSNPLGAWLSRTGYFEDFSFNSPSQDDDSISFRFDSGQVTDIQWLASLRTLVVGTTGSEWQVQGADGGAITPSSLSARPQSYFGSEHMQPLLIGSDVLFTQYGGSVIRDLFYSLEADGYHGDELSILAHHFLDGHRVKEWAYARLPYSIVWVVRDDGKLLGMTFDKRQDVSGWHLHETDGAIESICCIPAGAENYVYLVVKRTINGQEKRYIEVMMPRVTDETTYDFFFLDCGLSYRGAPANNISGLAHLEGRTVSALADGGVVEGLVVTGGAITLPYDAELVHVGIPYICDLQTLVINLNDDTAGATIGRLRTIPTVTLEFLKTRQAFVGPDADHLDEIRFREDYVGEAPIPLFTGLKEIVPDSGYQMDGSVLIRVTAPVPFTVLSITPNFQYSER